MRHKKSALIVLFIFLLLSAGYVYADEKQNEAFLEAADKGDLAAVIAFLEKGVDINNKGGYRQDTALIRAAAKGHEEIVKVLLAKGAAVNEKDKFGATALMYAAAGGHTAVIQNLLENKAEVNALDMFGKTALMDAVESERREIVKLLLAQKAGVNIKDKFDKTAWVYAFEKNLPEIKTLLKQAGAEELYTQIEWQGARSGETKTQTYAVTRKNRQWEYFWSITQGQKPLPEIDFDKYLVAVVFLGERPTGGYGVEFGPAYIKDQRLVIPYREHKPRGFVTQAFTQPWGIKIYERKGAGEIILEKQP